MQTASFSGFIKAIFYILIAYYVIKFVAKLFLPVVVRKVAQKAEENIRQQYERQQSYRNPREKGPETPKATRPADTKKIGEYVDYEEID